MRAPHELPNKESKVKHKKVVVVLVAVLAMTLGSLGVGNAISSESWTGRTIPT